MATHLLDVSLLVAYLWPDHVHHQQATQWLKGKAIALCPITEIGFIRVSTGALRATMDQARQALAVFLSTENPGFVAADLRGLDGPAAPNSKSTTDWYLANLAASHKMKLATLDIGLSHPARD